MVVVMDYLILENNEIEIIIGMILTKNLIFLGNINLENMMELKKALLPILWRLAILKQKL